MDGGITRQSEQYGIFEDRPRPARVAREAPEEVIREYTRGPGVGAGQLNPRNIRRQHFAVDTSGMDPRSHAYGGGEGDPLFGEFGHEGYDYEGVSRGEFNHRMRGRDPREESQMAREDIMDQDDESGYNWGPEPHHDDPFGGSAPDTPLIPLNQLEEHRQSTSFDREPPPSFSAARQHTADGPDPAAMMGGQLFTHMFVPGQRVGLPYNGQMIPGIVTHLHPDSQVGVRWHDGQHSTESPVDIQPF